MDSLRTLNVLSSSPASATILALASLLSSSGPSSTNWFVTFLFREPSGNHCTSSPVTGDASIRSIHLRNGSLSHSRSPCSTGGSPRFLEPCLRVCARLASPKYRNSVARSRLWTALEGCSSMILRYSLLASNARDANAWRPACSEAWCMVFRSSLTITSMLSPQPIACISDDCASSFGSAFRLDLTFLCVRLNPTGLRMWIPEMDPSSVNMGEPGVCLSVCSCSSEARCTSYMMTFRVVFARWTEW
mmetsp:Transcript_22349/g.39575  ORF Transcript_22349/g.39575 Transcript_22349/m.39575 type:complete len:246 (-) Transcript_22349:348-1085(-)